MSSKNLWLKTKIKKGLVSGEEGFPRFEPEKLCN
jgi:hypothetical protein